MEDSTMILAGQLARNEGKLARLNEKISLAIADMQTQQAKLQERNSEIRAAMKEAMEARYENTGEKKYTDDHIEVTFVAPTVRRGIDVKMLQAKEPEIYKQYEKLTQVSSSIRIKVKND